VKHYTCPICGYPDLEEPAYVKGHSTFEICRSCGAEFGNSDFYVGRNLVDVHRMMREQWLAEGAKWHHGTPPPGWDPRKQLRDAGLIIE
jgi:hypothetical protein